MQNKTAMSSKVFIAIAVVACVLGACESRTTVTAARDNDDRPVPEIPTVLGGEGVSASFGGYSASAGLGGVVGGSPGAAGGLYARAGTPDGRTASAGLGGSVNGGGHAEGGHSAGASAGGDSGSTSNAQGNNGHKLRQSPTFYNDIFNIPTSILGAVNRLLNGGASAVSKYGNVGTHQGTGGVHAGAGVTGGSDNIGTRVGAGAYAHVGTTGTTGSTGSTAGSGSHTSQGLFNDIFNIPITALNAVNQLLNNNPKNGK